jgi:hypothetical protein
LLELTFLRSLPLFVSCAAVVYLCLIRDRRWRVAHYTKPHRATHLWICVALGIAVACATVYPLADVIACPGDRGVAELAPTRPGGKSGIRVACRSEDDRVTDGSFFAPLFALLGVGVLVFAGASALLRSFGPPAPPVRPATTPALDVPQDRRERRRERKRDAHQRRT